MTPDGHDPRGRADDDRRPPRLRRRRWAALLAVPLIAFASVLVAACGDDDDSERDGGGVTAADGDLLPITGGTTLLELDDGLLTTLQEDGITVEPVAPATLSDGTLESEIIGGGVQPETLVGAFDHAPGGLRFRNEEGGSAEYSGFVISTGDGFLVAERPPTTVVGQLELSGLDATREGDEIVAGGIPVAIEGVPAEALRELGAEGIATGDRLGTLTIRAEVAGGP